MNVELHESVGVAGGRIDAHSREVPVVTVTFATEASALDDCLNGHYDPGDGRWANYAMTIPTARQLIADLNEALDVAISGERASDDDDEG